MDALDQAVASATAAGRDVPGGTETCLVCHGKGALIMPYREKFSRLVSPIKVPCGRCFGAGRVVSN